MLRKEELEKQPEYWIEVIQNDIFRAMREFMKREKLNQSQMALRMGVSKGYVSQILNGNFNFSLNKLVELCIFLERYPILSLKAFKDMNSQNSGHTNNRKVNGKNVNKTGNNASSQLIDS